MAKPGRTASFSWPKYGDLVKNARKRMGYGNRADFVAHVNETTGTEILEGTLRSIERGNVAPRADQFIAINICIFGDPMPKAMHEWFGGRRW